MTDFDPLAGYVSDFKGRRVLVLGDAILDEYLLGECSRISPEAPVPVLKVNTCRRVLGGAANTAANIVSLGGHATLIALVGDDEGGRTLLRCAADAGVELMLVDHGLATLRKTRVVGAAAADRQTRLRGNSTRPRRRAKPSHGALRREVDRVRHRGHLRLCEGFCRPARPRDHCVAHEAGRQVIVRSAPAEPGLL